MWQRRLVGRARRTDDRLTQGANPFVQGAVTALAGGTGAALTGGRFGDGFFIAASGYLFNNNLHKDPITEEEEYLKAEEWVLSNALGYSSPLPSGVLPLPLVGGDAAETAGGALTSGQLGQAGEAAVRGTYDIGDKVSININGQVRIPDGLTDSTVSEVKNVANQSFTQQLRDYLDFAQQTGRSFDLYMTPTTNISGPLQDVMDSGLINRLDIPQ